MNKNQARRVTGTFLVLLFGVTAATLLHRSRSFSDRENRSLAQMPKIRAQSLLDGSFESDYESYLTDQFPGRDGWIAVKTTAERASGKQETNDVYFAKDDYLIEKHTNTFTASQAERNVELLSSFAGKLSQEHTETALHVMIVPNAVDILKDKLPAAAAPYDEEDYLQQIREALPAGTKWVDASLALSAHAEEEIYYRTDHHWKTLGAFYAFQSFAESAGLGSVRPEDYVTTTVTENFEGTVAAKVGTKVKDDSIEQMTAKDSVSYTLTYNANVSGGEVRNTAYHREALDTRDKYGYFYGGNTALVQGTTQADTKRKILVIKDSYANCFVPFLYDRFAEVDMLDLRYYNASLSEYMQENNYTDVLFLYNAAGFAEDVSLAKLLG